MHPDRLCPWYMLVCFFFGPTIALADNSDAKARVAFESGVVAVERGDFASAADAFEAAFALRPTPSVEYNLAAALFEQGRYGLAQQHIEHILAGDSFTAGVLINARSLERRLRSHVAHLTVLVSLNGPQSARLFVDGEELPPEQWGTSRPVDPGIHTLRVKDDSGVVNEREVAVAPGVEASVDLYLRTVTQPQPQPPSAVARRDVREPRRSSWKLWLGVSAAVVVSAVAVGAGLAARGRADDPPQHSEGSLSPGALVW